MAKKTNTTRIFQLAKELGVTSKDLISKCQAEGIPAIKNHMSTVSPGLAETVREWFGGSGGPSATAVETAAPVDVVKARAKAKKKTRRARQPGEPSEAAKVPEVLAPERAKPSERAMPSEPLVAPEEPTDVGDAALPAEPVTPVTRPSIEPSPEPPDEDVELPAARPAAAASADGEGLDDAAATRLNVPERPQAIKPAGPMLQQPKATTLSGPKIIRVESPEVIRPRSRPSSGDSTIRRSGPRAGRGAGVAYPSPGEAPTEPSRTGRSSRRNKRRSASARDDTGRTGKAGAGTGTGTGTGSGAGATDASRGFNWRTQDLRERAARLNRSGGFFKAHRRDNQKRTSGGGSRATTAAETGGRVRVTEPLDIKTVSAASGIKAADIVKKLFLAGKPVTVNSTIDAETAIEVMLEFNIELEVVELQTAGQAIEERSRKRAMQSEGPRSPVVTILGHVDHGKTSLLDKIRDAIVAEGEAGGITQATSAFRVPVQAGEKQRLVTFIDTPGHEAFSEMRARGATVTDVVVLVIAADDGVMPQTVESINHAKAAGVPIVVALNKVDKPEATDANIQRILGQLAEHELNPTEWGGTTEVIRTSAIKNEGIQDLIEILDYQADLLELTADFEGRAEGTVLEAKVEEGRGPVANVLVEEGLLGKGDIIAIGRGFGRVRDIIDDHGRRITEAGPSIPVTISGFNEVPDAGDRFYIVKTIREAESAAAERIDRERSKDLAKAPVTLDNIFAAMGEGRVKELSLVIKADTQGSVDALSASLLKLSNDEVTIAIKHAAVGGINESDVALAVAARAIIVGFNVTTTPAARRSANSRSIDIRLYEVIYDAIDDVTKAAEGLLEPEHKLEVLGHAEVREVFRISRVGMIAGCYVTDGVIERNAKIRVTRSEVVIEKDRRLEQLKRFKDDAKEVRQGMECGMKIDGYDDIKQGDVLECYKTTEVKRTLTRA